MSSKKDIASLLQIPGLIEPIEIATLIEIGEKININPGDQITEFGAFIGRSTNAIMRIDKNKNYQSIHSFSTYDLFACNTKNQIERTRTHINFQKD